MLVLQVVYFARIGAAKQQGSLQAPYYCTVGSRILDAVYDTHPRLVFRVDIENTFRCFRRHVRSRTSCRSVALPSRSPPSILALPLQNHAFALCDRHNSLIDCFAPETKACLSMRFVGDTIKVISFRFAGNKLLQGSGTRVRTCPVLLLFVHSYVLVLSLLCMQRFFYVPANPCSVHVIRGDRYCL